jgi:hypothetical protein
MGYVALRAYLLSITHDEASTWAGAQAIDDLWVCFREPSCWGTANLHWLNTWLLRRTTAWLGQAEWVIRLPNVLALALYLGVLIRLLRHHSDVLWLRWAGFGLLATNPYLLDFFSLARGYALGCAFLLWSWEQWEVYQRRPAIGHALLSWLAAILAVLSNFTFLPYAGSLLGLAWLMTLVAWAQGRPESRLLGRFALVGIAMLAGLGALIWYPLHILSSGIEFSYGATSLLQTFDSLIGASLGNEWYLGPPTRPVMTILVTLASLGPLVVGLAHSRAVLRDPLCQMAWLLGGLCLGLCLQYVLLGTYFLENRTALMMIPLWGYLLWQGLLRLHRWRNTWGLALALAWGIFAPWHLARRANLDHVREWYYDAESKAVAQYLADTLPADERVSLGCDWIFSRALAYYARTGRLDQVPADSIMGYRTYPATAEATFMYVEPAKVAELEPRYQPIKTFGRVGVLCRRTERSD